MDKKKLTVLLLVLFAIGILAAGCASNGAKPAAGEKKAEKPQEIHVAYQNSSIIILLAKAKGMYDEEFAKDGVAIKYDLYLSGPPMIEAFAGGRADFAHTGDMPPVSARSAGVDIKVISRAGYTPAGNALLIRPDAPYKGVSELKGKKIAVQVGSSAHHFLILLLQKNGVNPNDVDIVNLPASDHQAALETNNVAAVATWEPWTSVLENAKAGKVLEDSSSGVKRYIGVFLARNEFAQKYPEYTERILKVNEKAAEFMKKNPDEALELIAKESKLPVSAISRIVKDSNWDSQIVPEDIAALQQVKDFLKETKVLKKDFDINELFDDTYYKKIKQ
ncbi:MAG TPA: aliphatic sulfonate ABC transporter substrate-binding protein [Methylomusa anaerophila]|uniref:Putative aliphatic sulfonates-binding protein n=1 Tax=Methylomusa anaerophila TaxID=1930071 RepID=A0A348AJ91_9FIRM|nr:aliphatic sulfonate ABC transporter substrate-binding protein [Methylomusa anaerophila]BBB91139.1 putative aliphatic sulfonates-binding protein precursor [Methylomusa anaerophila]HML89015.1 aliphatic sulfonate ABC transporter substrate-binding protein [Methylomusa anaerophila]